MAWARRQGLEPLAVLAETALYQRQGEQRGGEFRVRFAQERSPNRDGFLTVPEGQLVLGLVHAQPAQGGQAAGDVRVAVAEPFAADGQGTLDVFARALLYSPRT